MRHYLLFCFFLLSFTANGQATQKTITGVVCAEEGGAPIPYTTITLLGDNRYGTTSNSEGEFSFSFPESLSIGEREIHFSSIGFHNMILPLSAFSGNKPKMILMKEQAYELENINVSPNYTELRLFGDTLQNQFNDIRIITNPGFMNGITLRNPSVRLLDRIKIYFKGNDVANPPRFGIRIMHGSTMKLNQIYDPALFRDILKEMKIYELRQNGWFTIDLSKEKIVLPKGDILFLLVPLENNRLEDRGIIVPSYNLNQHRLFWLQYFRGDITNLDLAYPSDITPMMAVTTLEPKTSTISDLPIATTPPPIKKKKKKK